MNGRERQPSRGRDRAGAGERRIMAATARADTTAAPAGAYRPVIMQG
jgi:hypothetical protein